MNNKTKIIITFTLSLVISFFIVGYIKHTMFVATDWVEGVTIWNKFRVYYIRTFSANIIPSFIIAIIFTSVINFINRNRS
jgi:hypothetical protein